MNASIKIENAEVRLRLARRALIDTGYFTEDEVGEDIAPRIIELFGVRSENVHGADSCAWGGKCGCERRARGKLLLGLTA